MTVLVTVGSAAAVVASVITAWMANVAWRKVRDAEQRAALARVIARVANSPNGGTIYVTTKRHTLLRASVVGMTGLAALIAGRRRYPSLRDEWRSHLAGETGLGLPAEWRIRAARGFILAAVRCRIQDAADLAWKVAERVLRSRRLSNLFVLIPTTGMALFIFLHAGTLGVMLGMESIGTTGGLLYGLVVAGRKWRDVKPPGPRPRSKD